LVKEDRRMAMGKRDCEHQEDFWIPTSALPMTASHPFYEQVNKILDTAGFDRFVEDECRKFYAEKMGRPSLPPAIYFRLMLIGYFEGIDSERGIAWRVADSLGLRRFLGYALSDSTPDHSTISRNRRLIDVETHEAVFVWVLKVLAQEGLLKGKTIGIDATTLEANAAMRSIVRRDSGESYQEFLTRLAKESGIETPTREDLAKLDKKRKNKASNDDWENPHDPDAKITKMKDGRTHVAHKAEHATDMDTGAVITVTLQPGDRGDTSSIEETLPLAADTLVEILADEQAGPHLSKAVMAEAVTDKGYHSNDVLTGAGQMVARTYISEPDRGRRNWSGNIEARDAVYANRRRIRGRRGKRLMRKRGELIERSFAHCYDTGGMRRTHLRGHRNILKRLLIHVAGFNLSLVMRKVLGVGTARGLQGAAARALHALNRLWTDLIGLFEMRDALWTTAASPAIRIAAAA
jgi:transposase